MRWIDNSNEVIAGEPKSWQSTSLTGDIVSMKEYHRLQIRIQTGAWASGTAAVTLLQDTAVSATAAKTLPFDLMYSKLNTAASFTENTVGSDTFNLSAADTLYIIEIEGRMLDADNDFDTVRLDIASPGANADFYSATYVMYEPRHADSSMPSAIAD